MPALAVPELVKDRRRPEHVPDGDPLCSCGVLAYYHRDRRRPEHEPHGDPCSECGRDAADHRKKRSRRDGRRGRSGPSGPSGPSGVKAPANAALFVGVDGEGQNVGPVLPDGTRAGPHCYTYVAAVDEHGVLRGDLSAKRLGVRALSTAQCLDWLLSLGVGRVHGYAAGYDLTKMLGDLPAEDLHRLCRPELRAYEVERNGKSRTEHRPIHWFGYRLGYMKGRFTVQREEPIPKQDRVPGGPRYRGVGKSVVFWDVFRFFQGRFTLALEDWKVLDAAELARMNAMKDDRGADTWVDSEAVRSYCRDECGALAVLVRRLVTAHEEAGLRLTQFYGAGSTAAALMTRIGVKQYMTAPPPAMRRAMMCGFVGGRFEFSAVGPVAGPVVTDDLSSAYPYVLAHLPCLTHGTWEHVRADGPGGRRALAARIAGARLALVHARVLRTHQPAWGVLPWRAPNGTIVWPLRNSGTWVWKEEYEVGCRLADVAASEAWVYDTECDCRPFKELLEVYAERVHIGKEGPGIVLKLGSNSCYGKCAQSQGRPPFQSWVWAGCITSDTRAQLLRAVEVARDPWDVLGFATDAVFARRPLALPEPLDTGTARLPGPDGAPCSCAAEPYGALRPGAKECKLHVQKPLGGWERKTHDRGMFLGKPGVYFPLDPTPEDLQSKLIKARGMSGTVLLKNAPRILDHWRRHGVTEPVRVEGLRRFVGMNSGVTKYKDQPAVRSEHYGEWIPYPIMLSFKAKPKRERLLSGGRLAAHRSMPGESSPYKKGRKGPEAVELEEADRILADQPSGDFSLA